MTPEAALFEHLAEADEGQPVQTLHATSLLENLDDNFWRIWRVAWQLYPGDHAGRMQYLLARMCQEKKKNGNLPENCGS